MASPFQRQALNRKLIYAAMILVLFTVAYLWRSKEFHIFGRDIKGVDAQARDLAIREQSRGDVDLLGAIARLTTIGSRGLATCVLWINAMEAQKKNQWNELELYIRSLTKLQPHFITPWIYQSWNLAYNVSVESDRINDKYFYISRGLQLLAEGERRNRNHPDMRWSIGFFNQHKICQSDETNVLRSLSQLSMIPPNERDPGRFWIVSESGRQDINLKELEDFCQKHPQLVRRLREGMRRERRSDQQRQFRCDRAEDLVQFLEDNFRVPSLWVDQPNPSAPGSWKPRQDQQKPLAERFPVLPPRHSPQPYQQQPDETALLTEDPMDPLNRPGSKLLDEHDAYQVSRAWFSYAQEPLPKPDTMPGQSEPIVNRVYQRLPRFTTVIFRDYPAQAQRFTAERLQEEGWFDASGWVVTDWFQEAGDRFSDGGPALIGKQPWGREAWQKTREDWYNFGTANHLLLSEVERKVLEDQAKVVGKKYNLIMGAAAPIVRGDDLDDETSKQLFAWNFLTELEHAKHYCHFDFHYNRALVEAKEDTIQARKLFFEALDAQRMRNDEAEALRIYLEPGCIKTWRDKVLMSNKVFRGDSFIQEQTYQIQLRYFELYTRLHGRSFKAQATGMVLIPFLTPSGSGVCPVGLASWVPQVVLRPGTRKEGGGGRPQGLTSWLPPGIVEDWDNPLLGGPFDGSDDEGEPLVPDYSRNAVLQRLYPALFSDQTAPPSGTPPTPSLSQPR
ncbi:MAG: hypothetical protein ACYC3I_01915 [Gemmataceae bacterium]